MREEHARQLAAAAEAQRAALEQLREELLGAAGAEAAAPRRVGGRTRLRGFCRSTSPSS